MPLDLTAATNVLKEYYLPPVRNMLNEKILLWHRIKKNREDFEGGLGVIPLRTGRNNGVGARGEGETLPTAGNQAYNRATFKPTYQYGRLQVSGPVIKQTKSDEGAFIRAIDSEMKGLSKDFIRDFNRQLFITGRGDLATVTASAGFVGSRKTFTVSTGNGAGGTRWIQNGMRLMIHREDTDAAINSGIVVSTTTTSFTTSGSTGAVGSTAVPVRHNSFAREMFGLFDIVSTANPSIPAAGTMPARANFGNIDRSNRFWQANILSNSGTLRNLSLELMDEMRDTVDVEGDGETTLIIGDHNIVRSYARLMTPDRRFPTADGQAIDLDGGYKALSYDNIPVVKDRDCHPNRLYFLDESTFMFFEASELEWMDKDGAILNRVANTDAYEATLYSYVELACSDPRNNGAITDIQ